MAATLSLFVQYATKADELPRWRLRRWVAAAANAAQASPLYPFNALLLTVRLVDTDEGKTLNSQFRQRNYATNVLTFEYGVDADGMASGDIILCVPVLHREAAEQHKPLLHHAAHLTIHGVLHALGHDHIDPQEAQVMESLEIQILQKMGISNPYKL